MTVAVSVLKGDKMDGVVRDAVMMGATAVQPVVATRSEVTLAGDAASAHRGRRAGSASRSPSVKQCGRAVVPGVRAAARLVRRGSDAPTRSAALAAGGTLGGWRHAGCTELPRSDVVHLLVGPEGGWTPEESEACARAGCDGSVSLGARTLRAEIAPLVALAACSRRWRAW